MKRRPSLRLTAAVLLPPIISTALILAIVPISVLIAIFQERVVGGLTQGGLKG